MRTGFPILKQYPADRIELFTTFWNTPNSKIMDEAWVHLTKTPPSRLVVQVADGPDDEEASKCTSFGHDFPLSYSGLTVSLITCLDRTAQEDEHHDLRCLSHPLGDHFHRLARRSFRLIAIRIPR